MQSMDDTEKNLCRANNPGRTHTRHIPASWYICAIQQWHNSSHHRSYGFLDKQKYHRLNMFIFDCLFFACISVYYYWCCYFVVGCCCFFFLSLFAACVAMPRQKSPLSSARDYIIRNNSIFIQIYILVFSLAERPACNEIRSMSMVLYYICIYLCVLFSRWNICRYACDDHHGVIGLNENRNRAILEQ